MKTKGRVVESAGIRSYKKRSGPDRWHNRPGVDRVAADKAQSYCPRLERLVPWVLQNANCLDTHELLNNFRAISLIETIHVTFRKAF
jgi:hypothetical protein